VDWYIRANDNPSNPLLGTVLGSGTASPSSTYIETNSSGHYIEEESFDITPLAVSGGTTYWFELDNGKITSGEPLFWDESDGPSIMYGSAIGYFPGSPDFPCNAPCTGSESFELLGAPNGPTIPEPGTMALLGGALIALAGLCRHKK
jgi:hypothetical protein